ncbi:hypothetical protein BH18ACI2_BH18ACI2_16180 [soil metagenome]
MSEEKPTFKVTDRRLFNPDGSPRFTEDEAPAATSATAGEREAEPATAATATAAAGGATAETGPREATAASPRVETEGAASAAGARREQAAEADVDPTEFANLIMFIASPAAAAMGMTEHPGMGPTDIDLPLAKHCIDLLGTIQQKTHGNLSQQEQQMLEGLLGELRMQYVSLLNAPPPQSGPRGFTGGDIKGGR